METRILKIIGHYIYYTQNDYISFENSNFPNLKDFKFRSHIGIFWEVEIERYEPKNKTLVLNVVDYQSNKIEKFEAQTKNNAGLVNIYFNELLWNKIEPQFMFYKKSSFKEITNKDSYNSIDNSPPEINNLQGFNNLDVKPSNKSKEKINEEFYTTVHFKDAKFLDGRVRFYHTIKQSLNKVELEIQNPEIRKEFDFIKYHFPKIFKRKTFEVFGTKITEDYKVRLESISSPQITLINSSLVEQVKQIEFNRITKLSSQEEGKEIYNLNEIFDELTIDLKSGLFKENEQDLINFFLKDKNIKNKQQLVYLSGLKQTTQNRIKFTLKPKFGFLFTINGNDKSHYCWELLNSHATYLWSIPNSFKNKIEIVEENISLIKKIGRQKYKNQLNSKNDILPSSVIFNLIRHSSNKDGFIEWKEQLNSLTK